MRISSGYQKAIHMAISSFRKFFIIAPATFSSPKTNMIPAEVRTSAAFGKMGKFSNVFKEVQRNSLKILKNKENYHVKTISGLIQSTYLERCNIL
jgi:hypothetical protein